MTSTKKYVASMSVSDRVMRLLGGGALGKDYIEPPCSAQSGKTRISMTEADLQRLLEDVRNGTIDANAASDRINRALATAPFEDLGFARVDTHRTFRQGFPEVVLGLGKTPAQIAAISERIVGHGQSLLVTRANPEAASAVSAVVPGVTSHAAARAI